jgi:hypothetical protein
MAKRSAVELSPHRAEIDKLLLDGKSPRVVSDWLKNLKHNPESISHTAINNYRKNKLDVNKEATIRYNEKQSKKLFDEAVKKKVSDIEFLDGIIETADDIGLSVDTEQGITNLDIKKIGIQAVKVKHDITKDEPPVVVEVKVGEMDDKERKLTKTIADNLARQDEDSEESEPEC